MMPTLEKSQFLKPGADIKAFKLDRTLDVAEKLQQLFQQQTKILESKKIRQKTFKKNIYN